MFNFSGTRPTNIGVVDNKLTPCPGSPNCVCTTDSDKEHGIDTIVWDKSPNEAIAALKNIITGMERTEIIVESHDYLHAEFTSKLMGYVDDVEFYVRDGQIQMRSASRLGKSDLGVNRKRIEAISAALKSA